ncbi:DUF2917 domain-containing protein [Zeimonas arvi]|nr:DUF2917 domain-containing protein [Zeimonas arvi]
MFAQTFPRVLPRLPARQRVRPSERLLARVLARLSGHLLALPRPRAARAMAEDERLLRLAADELASLRIAAVGRIVVLRGRAWVTVDGDPADHFVARGESLALQPGSVARIGGDDPGATLVRFVPARQATRDAPPAWRRGRLDRRLLEASEHMLRDIGAPDRVIEAARAYRSAQGAAGEIARRLEFLR